ncbi:L-threonylcarbamoyladenylate synthase [Mariprofundus erugo]|uniref:L-threonylcarbamoyladenylate synthase n=1 Tax=Mariprofundus erugo TaxID=2528639 RepID=UPI001EE8AA5E|nr:Sua5/YciO/YrdC/YwlC family protein [Mariprofundus erugo]
MKLAALRGAGLLRQGALIAHHTATLPGIAACVHQPKAVRQLIRFKQRPGPFLLLADSIRTAAGLARYFSPELRRRMRNSWPGPVTLVFAGRPGLPACCYQHGFVAVRVDASRQTRQLAAASGSLLASSSLNRRGGAHQQPGRQYQMRLHRYIHGRVCGHTAAGRGSTIIRIRRNNPSFIRR